MSYGIYVGRDHTAEGIAYLAGYGDEPSSHWLEVVPRRQYPPGATMTVGVTPEAKMPGLLSEIPQVAETLRHLRVSYSHYRGVPTPLTNGGLNEQGVAVRDIWSTSRADLIEMTPKDQRGPNYSDLARTVLERAGTAREGVEIIGALIARHGYSTYGGNSHLIADPDEGWVVIEFAGGQGLWAAERLGPRSIRVSRPGYIGLLPPEELGDRFLASPNFHAFAEAQGWWRPGTPFDVNAIYGDGMGRWAGLSWMEEELAARAARPGKLGFEDLVWALRTPRITGDTAGYGQIVPLVHPGHDALRLLWHAQVGALAAPFVPLFLGIASVPEEYRQHRYLTSGEDARFLDSRHGDAVSSVPQGIESTRSASASHKRLLYLLLQRQEFLPEVTAAFTALERRLVPVQAQAARAAALALDAGDAALAADILTYFCGTELDRALALTETLAASLEVRTRLLHGISEDTTPKAADQLW